MNEVRLSGYIGEIELRYTSGSGTAVCNIRLATSEGWLDKNGQRQERTEWHTVVVWGKGAEAVAKAKSVGDWLLVKGQNKTRTWEDRNGSKHYTTEVHADPGGVEFGPKTEKRQQANAGKAQSSQQGFDAPPPVDQGWSPAQHDDDQIPF